MKQLPLALPLKVEVRNKLLLAIPNVTTDTISVLLLFDADGFNFPHLLSGKFRVAVKSDNWCWDEDAFDVVLDQEDITNIEFKQTGYLLKVVSSHAMDVELGTQGEKISTWSIKKGENTKCIKKAGNFILKPISCYQFGKESFSWSTDAPKTISLQAKNLKVSGKIEITNVPKGFSAKDLSVSFGASSTYRATLQLCCRRLMSSMCSRPS
jgi:hypothetical protein